MKVRDLMAMNVDVDVYDDYDERIGIAFCGALALTNEGIQKFARALELVISIESKKVIVHCETEEDAEEAMQLFYSAAGYCSATEWDKWFKEDNYNG